MHTLVPSDRVERAAVYGRDGTKLGTIEPGKWADFDVFDKNPLDVIRNTESLSAVYIAGNEVKR